MNGDWEDALMFRLRLKILAILCFVTVFMSAQSLAGGGKQGWSLNLGYHNPPNSTVGVNFLRFWKNFAFEAGIGWLDWGSSSRNRRTQSDSDNTSTLSAAGDVNLKYLFGDGSLRPYIQGGIGTAGSLSIGENTGASASAGQLFGGGGFFLTGQSVYGYGSFNTMGGDDTFFQAGLGFYF
jgi:hypothetical protein